MTNEELKSDVVRQALIEYLSARCCIFGTLDPSDTQVINGLEQYVARRYGSHPARFRADKLAWLFPRVKSVMNLLKEMGEGSWQN